MFDNDTSKELLQLLESLNIPRNYKSYQRGNTIYSQEDQPNNIYFLDSGLVGLYTISENGNETLLRIFSNKRVFGHRSLLARETYHATAIALSDTHVITYTKEDFEKALQSEPKISLCLNYLLSRELKAAENRLADMTDKTAKQRIIEGLIFLKHRKNEYEWTRKEIADFCGTTVETVARVLTQLAKEGCIIKTQRNIEIPNTDKLLEICGQ